jgi:hypothetical protein
MEVLVWVCWVAKGTVKSIWSASGSMEKFDVKVAKWHHMVSLLLLMPLEETEGGMASGPLRYNVQRKFPRAKLWWTMIG